MTELWIASYVALWLVVAALAFVTLGLLRQLGLIQMRLGPDPGVLITPEGLERGTPAPDFDATDVETDELVHLADFQGRRLALVFLSPSCLACRQLVPHLNDIARERQNEAAFIAICNGDHTTVRVFRRLTDLQIPLLVDPMNTIATRYRVPATPFAFLIDQFGVVLIRGVVNSWPQLDALLEEEGTLQSQPWVSMDPAHASKQLAPVEVEVWR